MLKASGSSSASGCWNLNNSPFALGIESVAGLKERDPENAKAVASSGEVTKECVPGLPSWRLKWSVHCATGRVSVYLPGEITVEGGNDRIYLALTSVSVELSRNQSPCLWYIGSVPLSNTWTTRTAENNSPCLPHFLQESRILSGCSNLFAPS